MAHAMMKHAVRGTNADARSDEKWGMPLFSHSPFLSFPTPSLPTSLFPPFFGRCYRELFPCTDFVGSNKWIAWMWMMPAPSKVMSDAWCSEQNTFYLRRSSSLPTSSRKSPRNRKHHQLWQLPLEWPVTSGVTIYHLCTYVSLWLTSWQLWPVATNDQNPWRRSIRWVSILSW